MTTRNKFRVCTACNLQILLEEKEKIRRMKEASAEEKEKMRKEKERLYKIEVEKRKKRNEKFMKAQDMVKKSRTWRRPLSYTMNYWMKIASMPLICVRDQLCTQN